MSIWRQLTRGLRVLTRPAASDRDLTDEVAHYFEQAIAELEAKGFAPAEARRIAQLEQGSIPRVQEDVRVAGWEHAVETFLADLRYGARRLRAAPGFTVVSVLTLALGIGASTAIFSVLNPIVIQPLPYPEARGLTLIWDTGRDGSRQDVTFGSYREIVERSRSFESLAVLRSWQPTLTGADHAERLEGQRVSASYFRTLGVAPRIGRDFQPSDDAVNGPAVVLISNALWERLGRVQEIVGRDITLDDRRHTVIGVMPANFENVLVPTADVWQPLQYDPALPPQGREWGHHLRLLGRLRAGITIGVASTELNAIAQAPVSAFARPDWAALDSGLVVNSLQDDVTRAVKPALFAVFGAALLVLAIACVNITNLLLARGAQRRGEFALRAALGAAKSRLMRQLLTESLLLAILGGGVGIVLAWVSLSGMVALAPSELPRAHAVGIDAAAYLYALIITAVIGFTVGLIPALQASRRDVLIGLQSASPRMAGDHRVTRQALVVAEIALAVVLLVSAGLLLRTVQRLFAIDPGFTADHVLTMQVQASGRRFDDAGVTHRFFADALEAVERVPGVVSAGLTSQLPLSGDLDVYGVHFASSPAPYTDEDRGAFRYAVSAGYFETMGIRLKRGRLLDMRDTASAPLAVVLNESFARRRFPGQDPIGQRLHIGPDSGPWFTVVGLVGDVRQTSLAVSQADAVYVTTPQWHDADRTLWVVVRALGDAVALAPSVRDAIASVDKLQPVVRVAPMQRLLERSEAERRFGSTVFEAFSLMALALAAIGIYGLLSAGVTERWREIGIRSALGASRGNIVRMIVRQGMTLTTIGIVGGLLVAMVATRAVATLLFGVSSLDGATYAAVVLLASCTSAIACSLPAIRAGRIDPSVALRME